MFASHSIQDISFDQHSIYLKIDGRLIKVALDKLPPKLKQASDVQRNLYKISPSGYGIHWPLLDEDLAVDALLKLAE